MYMFILIVSAVLIALLHTYKTIQSTLDTSLSIYLRVDEIDVIKLLHVNPLMKLDQRQREILMDIADKMIRNRVLMKIMDDCNLSLHESHNLIVHLVLRCNNTKCPIH